MSLQHRHPLMLGLAAFTVLLSLIVHGLHRQFGFLQNDETFLLSGRALLGSGLYLLQNVMLSVPVILILAAWLLYRANREHPLIVYLVGLTFTFGSISIIAGGDGRVEYHFSIFMVLAMIAYYDNIKLLLVCTGVFAVHHLAGYFWFPQLLCGTAEYRFDLLMIHAVFLLLTSGATVLLIVNKKARMTVYEQQVNSQRTHVENMLATALATGKHLLQTSEGLKAGADEWRQASYSAAEGVQEMSRSGETQEQQLAQSAQQFAHMHKEVGSIRTQAQQVAQLAQHARQWADSGNTSAEQLVTLFHGIGERTQSVQQRIRLLAQRSDEIEQFVAEVSGIADQTQLLALNASIEAARAGEAGRGFAIVADEVHRLSQQANAFATRIREGLAEMRRQIGETASYMDESTVEVSNGITRMEEARTRFDTLASTNGQVQQQMADVLALAEQLLSQSDTTRLSLQESRELAQVLQHEIRSIAAAARQQAQHAEDMRTIAYELHQTAEQLAASGDRKQPIRS